MTLGHITKQLEEFVCLCRIGHYPKGQPNMAALKINDFGAEYQEFLRDESRRIGSAQSISFPKTEQDVEYVLTEMTKSGTPVTIQGARTGITAGAVPEGGHIMNLSRMKGISGLRESSDHGFVITVEPGVILSDLRERLENQDFDVSNCSGVAVEEVNDAGPFFFPPDPTEASATIGGMVSCNASGSRSFWYGPTRDYVERLKVVFPGGASAELTRGDHSAQGRSFSLLTGECQFNGTLPGYSMPKVKNASGYYVKDSMDMIDLFIGSEGTLGVITEVDLRVVSAPKAVWGLMAFFGSEEEAVKFVLSLKSEKIRSFDAEEACRLVAIEFFNHGALDLLRQQKGSNPAFSEIPDIHEDYHTAVYVEFHGQNEDSVSDGVLVASEAMLDSGGDEDQTWLASEKREMQRLKDFRHALPEAVNLTLDERRKQFPELTKLGTDMAVPEGQLENVLKLYNEGIQTTGLEAVLFGHIGDNHVHVNIIPRSVPEYEAGKQLYLEWAGRVLRMGGTVSAEHGIGKLKVSLLREMYGEQAILEMKALKSVFDPRGILNRGNLFSQRDEELVGL